MCRQILHKWNNLETKVVHKMLKDKFPACGIKYTSQHGQGLVLIMPHVNDIEMVKQKAKAAGTESGIRRVFIIPKSVAAVYGHIPTLTDAL